MGALKWLKYFLMERNLEKGRLIRIREDLNKRSSGDKNYNLMRQMLLNEIEDKLSQQWLIRGIWFVNFPTVPVAPSVAAPVPTGILQSDRCGCCRVWTRSAVAWRRFCYFRWRPRRNVRGLKWARVGLGPRWAFPIDWGSVTSSLQVGWLPFCVVGNTK